MRMITVLPNNHLRPWVFGFAIYCLPDSGFNTHR
jgi:hypothetical protein